MAYRIRVTNLGGVTAPPGETQYGPTPNVGDHLYRGVYATAVQVGFFDPIEGETVDLVEAAER